VRHPSTAVMLALFTWLLLLALLASGCAFAPGYHAQLGPWSKPLVKGKQGLPDRQRSIQDLICQKGPSPQYPTFDPFGECI
jgi:hypothetical protein